MNNYLVLLTNVMKLVHPFKDNLFPERIYLKEIDKMLDGTLNTKNMQPEKLKILEEVVNRVNYYYPKEIDLHLTQDNIKNVAMLDESLIDLAAAIYRHEKHIVCNVTGDKELVKSLLGVDLDKPDNITLPIMESNLQFDWALEEVEVSNAWDDPQFIINYLTQTVKAVIVNNFTIKSTNTVKDERLQEIVKFATPEVWNNQELVNKVMSFNSNAVNFLTFEILLNPTVLAYTKQYTSEFSNVWDRVYKYLYDEKGNFDQSMLDKYDEPYKSQIANNLKTIENDFLGSKVFVLKLCRNTNVLEKFFEKIPPEVKYSDEVLKELSSLADSKKNTFAWRPKKLFKDLPNELATDIDWIRKLFNDYSTIIAWHTLPDSYHQEGLGNIFKAWINDKDLVLKFMQESKTTQFSKVFDLLPSLLKNDDSMIKTFMENYPIIYSKLPGVQKPQYLKKFLLLYKENNNSYNIKNHVTTQEICKLNDKDVFVHLAEQGYADWFDSPLLDKKWHQDVEVIRKVAAVNEEVYKLPSIKDILKDLPREKLIELITKSKTAYEKLTGDMRNDHELALLCIKHHRDSPSISNNLYWSKSFCVEALKANNALIKKIPKEYWKQKDFILGICKGLDDKSLSAEMLNQAPAFVKPFFDSFSIKENYTDFMENYLLRLELNKKLIAKKVTGNKKKI